MSSRTRSIMIQNGGGANPCWVAYADYEDDKSHCDGECRPCFLLVLRTLSYELLLNNLEIGFRFGREPEGCTYLARPALDSFIKCLVFFNDCVFS
jgi:hypothetical protein